MIEALVQGALDGMVNSLSTRDESELKEAVAEWLRWSGYHVCDGDDELRELALSETDLVEPSEET